MERIFSCLMKAVEINITMLAVITQGDEIHLSI